MSKRRRKSRGTGGMVFLSERSGTTLTEAGSRLPPRPSERPAARPARMEVAPLDRRASVPITPEALGALTTEMSRFNRMLEDMFSREKSGRSPEEHKEMWVLLSALTVVVVFCFVAFYLNQSEVREMHSGLQSEIDHAGKSAVTSMERALSSLRLERIPESTAALEGVIKEKDRRDVQRMGDLQSAIKALAEKSGAAAQDELKGIEGELKALRRISEEIKKAQAAAPVAAAAPAAAPAVAPPTTARPAIPTEVALKSTETKSGRAARASDGTPQGPPDPAARPPGQTISTPGPPAGGGLGEPR